MATRTSFIEEPRLKRIRPIRIRKNQYVWYLAILSLFFALNVIALWLLQPVGEKMELLNVLKLFLIGLATYRSADIISREHVAQPIRQPFVNIYRVNGETRETPKASGYKEAIGRLITCPSCVGVWTAAGLTYGYLLLPKIFWVVVLIFAASALERLFTLVVLLMRRYAEILEQANV